MKAFLIITFLFFQSSLFSQQKNNLPLDEKVYFKSVQYLNLNEVQLILNEVEEIKRLPEIDRLINKGYDIYISKRKISSYNTNSGSNYVICFINEQGDLIKGFFAKNFWKFGMKKYKITGVVQKKSSLFKNYLSDIFHLYKNNQTNEIELKQVKYKDYIRIESSFEVFINIQDEVEKIFVFDLYTKMGFSGILNNSEFYKSLKNLKEK